MWRLRISIAVMYFMNGVRVHYFTLYNKVRLLPRLFMSTRIKLLQSGDPVNTCLLHVLREFRG